MHLTLPTTLSLSLFALTTLAKPSSNPSLQARDDWNDYKIVLYTDYPACKTEAPLPYAAGYLVPYVFYYEPPFSSPNLAFKVNQTGGDAPGMNSVTIDGIVFWSDAGTDGSGSCAAPVFEASMYPRGICLPLTRPVETIGVFHSDC